MMHMDMYSRCFTVVSLQHDGDPRPPAKPWPGTHQPNSSYISPLPPSPNYSNHKPTKLRWLDDK